jgi:hypothetical protein
VIVIDIERATIHLQQATAVLQRIAQQCRRPDSDEIGMGSDAVQHGVGTGVALRVGLRLFLIKVLANQHFVPIRCGRSYWQADLS